MIESYGILGWIVIGLLAGGIGFWAILWDPKNRALHDRWSRTIVVQS